MSGLCRARLTWSLPNAPRDLVMACVRDSGHRGNHRHGENEWGDGAGGIFTPLVGQLTDCGHCKGTGAPSLRGAVKAPTGESWPAFFWGVPVSAVMLWRTRWVCWRLDHHRAAVARNEQAMRRLRAWSLREIDQLK